MLLSNCQPSMLIRLSLLVCVIALTWQALPAPAQTEPALPAACHRQERQLPRRFYQRGNAPDDLTDDDLWQVATFSEQGIDPAVVAAGLARLAESPTRQSLILMRNGYMVYEQYFNGSHVADSNNIASVSKSILSALFGIAFEQGFFLTVEDRVADYLPDYFDEADDPRLLDLRLRDMLTMTHGLAWKENESERMLNRSDDWVADILSLPISNEPGTLFHYSTGASHVMSAVLTEATGMSACEFAHRNLFAPLGIEAEFWGVDPAGYFTGGHSVSMTAREVARFGQLYLQEGRWQGQQVAPGWWVVASTSPQLDIGNNYAGYGYYWWLNRIATYDMYSALGAAGQILHVIPELELVMVTTHSFSGNPRDYAEEAESYQFLWNDLIPAIDGP